MLNFVSFLNCFNHISSIVNNLLIATHNQLAKQSALVVEYRDSARRQLNSAFVNQIKFNIILGFDIECIERLINDLKDLNRNKELFQKCLLKHLPFKVELILNALVNREELMTAISESQAVMLLNTVLATKKRPLSVSQLPSSVVNGTPLLSQLIFNLYQKKRQNKQVYDMKVELRQRIYSLLSNTMKEKIDLYLIGSSLTGLGSKTSDTDLCLIIYDSQQKIDKSYEDKTKVMAKLEELRQTLETNGISEKPEVIPALVPILKFIEMSSGIEVNINLNRIVSIRNTHLLHIYSQMDSRVAPLIVTIKLWARKNGINSAFNKSLTSYSISLMTIYFLQNVCNPPVLPCLQRDYPQLFDEDVTVLRLGDYNKVNFTTHNRQDLGELFTKFLEYFSLYFPFDKVISVRAGALIDRQLLVAKHDSGNGKLWQWKCHICIEEPFDRTNTSHAVHDCKMFRQILYALMTTYQQIRADSLTIDHFI